MTIDFDRRKAMTSIGVGLLTAINARTSWSTFAGDATQALPPRLRALGVFSPIASEPDKDGGNRLARFEQWLGRKVWKVADNASETGDWTQLTRTVIYIRDFWGKKPVDLLIRIPLLPYSAKGQFSAGARGQFDPYFLELARALSSIPDTKSSGRARTLRLGLGWENNGNWYPWFAKADPGAYKAFYQRIVEIFRTVDTRFRFDWNTSLGTMHLSPDLIFPGKDHVDSIGLDIYDEFPMGGSYGFGNHVRRFSELYQGGPFGLNYWNSRSRELGLPIVVGEWGVTDWTKTWMGGGMQGGGDNPYFIEQMAAWFDSLSDRLVWQSYFERFYKGTNHSLSRGPMLPDGRTPGPTQFPKSSAKFLELFGKHAT